MRSRKDPQKTFSWTSSVHICCRETRAPRHCCGLACQLWEVCLRDAVLICIYNKLHLISDSPFPNYDVGRWVSKDTVRCVHYGKRLESYNYNFAQLLPQAIEDTLLPPNVPVITLGTTGSSHLPLGVWEKAPYYFSDSIRCWVIQQQPHHEELKIERNGWHHL